MSVNYLEISLKKLKHFKIGTGFLGIHDRQF